MWWHWAGDQGEIPMVWYCGSLKVRMIRWWGGREVRVVCSSTESSKLVVNKSEWIVLVRGLAFQMVLRELSLPREVAYWYMMVLEWECGGRGSFGEGGSESGDAVLRSNLVSMIEGVSDWDSSQRPQCH